MKRLSIIVLSSALLLANSSKAQQHLSLKEALQLAADNYGTVKAKANYANASKASVDQAKREYLPNLNLGVEQAYGTINGTNGPLYAFGGAVASSGPALGKQNWNAAFGALYLANMNWDFFAFGRARDRVRAAVAVAQRDNNDYRQETFQQKIKVAAAYLNLVAAQRITTSYRKNLLRADTSRLVVIARAKGGLIAGVDSSQANAEISGAKILLIQALNAEQEQAKNLAVLIGSPNADFVLDTIFTSRIPADVAAASSVDSISAKHPVLDYYKSRITVSDKQADYYRTFSYPTFSLQGVFQSRGSGFSSNYIADQTAYSGNYWDGVNPTRSNYLIGVGVSWNFTQPFRVAKQVKAQRLISAGLTDEYNLARQELTAQVSLSDKKILNALTSYREVPVQIKAAGDAWIQKSVLYKNGLTNLVDVTQARYALIRAETDRDIAYNNVWQALLLKAAATGDLNLFVNEL
ncbi:TolC family protein [Mucilaginibacter achroorhodeus]|uniref:TolC family protein n=1 Tax=Mucilaginibacter achroorhodeus TaxID=2599294 RepID=A0A563U5S0_9SPHI|nr:TolC family protein [Mucilaginibacter achroorhodeus]TWR26678.1 TolC family protein [Mucilaginibacter achroorhodeus]